MGITQQAGIRMIMMVFSVGGMVKQAGAQEPSMKVLEQNLTESRSIIFADSTVPRFYIEDRMRHYKIPSASIAYVQDGRILWTKAYGYADAAAQRPATPATLYQVASISKSVHGFGMMRLVQQGKLSLDADIRSYLKSWAFPDNELSRGKAISLRQLLSHTAGLNVHGFIGYPIPGPLPTINQILNGEAPANHEAVKPIHAPGTQFDYSGGGYAVMRKILDDQVTPDYARLMDDLVLKPAGMQSSRFSQPLPAGFSKDYAFGHDQDMKPLKGNYYVYPELAAGGLWSTASDIARFIVTVQQQLKGGSLLDKEHAETMLKPVMDNYALGFGVEEKGGEWYFRHEGQSFGYHSLYYGSFRSGRGVVILTNAYPENGGAFLQELMNAVAITYQWKGFYEPVKKKLVNLPADVLDTYVGDYVSEDGRITIAIRRNGDQLELTARRPERMYAQGERSFFLASSPEDDCVFSRSSANGPIDVFEVVQQGKTIIRAVKKKN